MSIHATAIIEDGAQLGAGCVIHPYAIIKRGSVLGDGVAVHPFAVVGGDPNFLKFDPATVSGVRIGAGTIIREHVTINRSIYPGKDTTVGARCYLMANAHVGHDCNVGDDAVLATNIMLGGHVDVGSFTFFGGGAGAHQFCRIGEGVMIAGLARITQDLAPFLLVAERNEVSGLNLIGLKRRSVSREAIGELKDCYRTVFAGGDPRKLAAERSSTGVSSGEARRFLEFFAGGKRGFARPESGAGGTAESAE
jgi:UDP-N-acetylglucosamine acyltransferase